MRILFSLLVITTILSACSQTTPPPSPTQSGETASGSMTGDIQEPLVETLTGTGNDFYPMFNNTGSEVIHARHTAGTATKISFINHDANSMLVKIDFPNASGANLRLSRIMMPDGTYDGPFGKITGYNLLQKGGYELIFNENQMAGDPWSGFVDITVTLSGGTYGENTVLFD